MNTRHLRLEDLRGKRWRGWIRESTERQAAREATPQRQREDILRAADELGMVPSEPRWYERTGSGEAEGMPELARALAEAAEYDVLVAFTTSRFARNRVEAGLMKRRFRAAGIVIYFVADRLISGARTSSLTEGIKEVLDEEENETRRMWIAGGLRQRQAAGRWVGAIPFGYARALVERPDGTRGWEGGLTPASGEAELVSELFTRLVAGESLRAIALSWNATGRSRRGQPWSAGTLRRMVRSRAYRGEVSRYGEHTASHYYPEDDAHDGRWAVPGDWPALVDEATWTAAQAAIGGPSRRAGYPLSGVLRCARCRSRLVGVHAALRYYRCAARLEGRCDLPYLRADRIEAAFSRWWGTYELPERWPELLAARREAPVDRERVEGRLTKLRDLYLWGDLSADAYRAQASAIRAALPAPVSVVAAETVARHLAELALWTSQPWPRQAELARAVLAEALVDEGQVEWVARPEVMRLLELCRHDAPVGASLVHTLRG